MTPARRRGRPVLAVALLAVLLASPRLAAAQEDPYSAMVTVDATSESVAKARDVARVDGARRALNAVVEKLAGGPGKAKPLKLGDNQVTDLVASFEVAGEKMTAVRYTADYTYHFKPAEVAKAMQGAGIGVANADANPNTPPSVGQPGGGRPLVVLPVYQDGGMAVLWDDPNPWRDAWSQRPPSKSGTSLLVPLGDVSDLTAIDGDKARGGDAVALAAIAKKEGADEVLVMLATQRAGEKAGIDVTVRRFRAGQFVDTHFDAIDGNPGEADADLFRRAADTIAADLDSGWKGAKTNAGDQQGSLIAIASITGLDDWLKLRDRLSGMPAVRKIDVKSLSRQEAAIEIQYVGGMDQLKANLAAMKLGLEGGDPVWRLARSTGDRP